MSITALPAARSCVVGEHEGAALLVAFSDFEGVLYGIVVLDDGFIGTIEAREIRVKFPPNGEDRLLLGWAEKGNR